MGSSLGDAGPYVSTGHLPPSERVRDLIEGAHRRFRDDASGELSGVYPSLAAVDPEQFGICVAGVDGTTIEAGDADVEFSIMSVAKPFVLALVSAVHTPTTVLEFVGANATGGGSTRSPPSRTNRTAGRTRWSIRARSRPRA